LSNVLAPDFSDLIAARVTAEHRALAARWLERLTAVLPVDERDVFPSDTLLDHIPQLIREIGAYLRVPEQQAIAANTAVIDKARQLGELRHRQRASVHQVVHEYRILGGILADFVRRETGALRIAPPADQYAEVLCRLNDCVGVLLQTTVDTFIEEYTGTIERQTGRLEGFNRMVSHELRQPLGTLQFALALLRRDGHDAEHRDRVLTLVERNVSRLVDLTRKLESLSRLQTAPIDTASHQQVEVAAIAGEVARQLQEMAAVRGVDIRIDPALPSIVVDPARLELVLTNLVSNGIKYRDPTKPSRFVEVTSDPNDFGSDCAILVRDNGVGVARESVDKLFTHFYRAHAHRDDELGTDGIGLGLAIVADCVKAMHGRIEVESREGEGTTFRLTLPCA
jgi:signal transduction histidine kinase